MIDPIDHITDPSDVATHQEGLARQSAIVTSRRPAGPEPTGACHFCEEPLAYPLRFCGPECRDGWEREQSR